MHQDTDIFKAVSIDVRRDLLVAMLGEDQTVSDLTESVNISQSAVSQHLTVLKTAGLVKDRKVGRNRYYSVCIDQLLLIDEWLAPFRDFWPSKLDALETQLSRRKN